MLITIVATISRPHFLDSVITQIVEMCHLTHVYEIVLAIDNREITKGMVQNSIRDCKKPHIFQKMRMFNTGRPKPRVFEMTSRRSRIAKLHNEARNYLGNSEMTFIFEDDTVLPPDVILKLLGDHVQASSRYNVGIVQGAQVGRWGVKYVGAWHVDDVWDMKQFRTLPYSEEEQLEHIDAGGFYCLIVPTALYRSVEIDWKEPTGPDVYFGLELKRQGYSNFIDWGVKCGHMTKTETLWPGNDVKIVQLTLEDSRWQQKIITN